MNIMRPGLGSNIHRRVGDATAKIVFPIWACPKIGRIAIQPKLAAEFPLMPAGSEREILCELEKIAERSLHRSCGRVKCLEQSIIELQRRIGLVRRRERRRRANDAENRFEAESRRNRPGVRSRDVTLTVDVAHAETRIEHRLIGIRCWSS